MQEILDKMRVLNSNPKEVLRMYINKKYVLVTLLEQITIGCWVRVYRKPNGKYVGKSEMGAPKDWKFVFSFPYEGKN
jgi:hypothetical protein